MKRGLATSLAVLMVLSSTPTAVFAETSEAILNAAAASFNVTVPTVLPINIDANQTITVANDVYLENNSIGPVEVHSIGVIPINGWSEVETVATKVGLREFNMAVSTAESVVPAKQSTLIEYSADVSPQKVTTNESIANVIFTVGWDSKIFSDTELSDPSDSQYSFAIGDTKEISFKFKDAESDIVTFTSSNEQVATVEPLERASRSLISGEKRALVTAVGIGTAEITGQLQDGTKSTLSITVENKILQSIELDTPPNKTSYIEGQDFNTDGLVVKAIYNNGDSEEVSDYALSNNNGLKAGQTSVGLTYGDKEIQIPITVVSKSLTGIEIETAPNQTSYIEGQDFNTDGLVVIAKYDNNTTKTITDYILKNNLNLTVSQESILVEYQGKTASQPITVKAKALTEIRVKTPPTVVSYIEGNIFNKSGMVVEALYNNGTAAIITDYTIVESGALTVGQTSVTISYGGKTTAQAITVDAKSLTNVTITKAPTKVAYIEGNNFDPAGMEVTAHYNNGTSTVVSSGWSVTNGTGLKAGQTGVTISFGGKTVTQPITVAAKSLSSINISKAPTKTAYIEGNNFDKAGLVVEAIYNNGTREVISEYTLSNHTSLVKGQTSVTISYGGKTATQSITVAAKSLNSISVSKAPTKTAYIEGNNFDPAGMVVTAYYNNGTNEAITGYTHNGTSLVTGDTSVTISYGGKTATQSITVVAKSLASIAISKAPTKVAYIEGNTFDPTGMQLKLNYNNGTSTVVSTGWTITNGANLVKGSTSVTISYGGKTTTQPITVAAKSLSSISVSKAPTKTAYIEGQDFDKAGLVVEALYNNGSKEVITGYTLSNNTALKMGQTSVTITYGGKTTTQAITVRAIAIGDKYTSGNYEYSYGQDYYDMYWDDTSLMYDDFPLGWGVRVIDKTKTSYVQPLEEVWGKPVVIYASLFKNYTNPILTLEGTWTNKNLASTICMFEQSKASRIDLSKFSTTNVIDMSNMFSFSSATTIDLSNINTSRVSDMSNMFNNSAVTSIIGLTEFNTSNVTNMDFMFNNVKDSTIDTSSFDTSKVTSMYYMFAGTSKQELDLRNFNTTNVTSMRNMFFRSQAAKLDLSSFDTSNVTDMADMFMECKATVGHARTQADADKFNSSSDKPDTLDFFSPLAVGNIFSKGNYKYTYGSAGWSVSIIDTTKTSYAQPLETIQGKPVVSYNALFKSYPNTVLTLEGVWENSNVVDMKEMFNGSQVTSLNLGNFHTPKVTTMHDMFGNSKATTLDLSSFNTSNVTNMTGMFFSSKATSLNLSNWNTANITSMRGMFQYSEATTITGLDGFNTSKVQDMGSMFSDSKATALNLKSFNTASVTNMARMFWGSKATTLDLSSFDTSSVTDMEYIFYNSIAVEGCARNQAEADKFNTTSYKPAGLTFYPLLVTGDVYTEGNYKYTYETKGWGVEVIDKTKTSYVQPLEVIQGKPVRNYSKLFMNYANPTLTLSGVWTNKNVTSTNQMFENCAATSLNLSNFYTPNVTGMSTMFKNSQATTLNVSKLDTSKVSRLAGMFSGSKATTLDLSSFDTSNVSIYGGWVGMLSNVAATTGYAKTQADADRLNSKGNTNIPSTLKFVVK